MAKGFKEFILRGNVVDLAVAVVIGVAFGAVVSSFVADLLTPLLAAIGGKPDFSALTFTLHGSTFHYGKFVNAVISFLIIAAAVYYLVVLPIQKLEERQAKPAEPPPKPEEVRLLAQIRDLLQQPPRAPA